jgi:hypothetical protein
MRIFGIRTTADDFCIEGGLGLTGSFNPGGPNGWFCQQQIPSNGLSIDPKRASDPPAGPASAIETVNGCLQTHFEDVRHAPLVPHLRGLEELF